MADVKAEMPPLVELQPRTCACPDCGQSVEVPADEREVIWLEPSRTPGLNPRSTVARIPPVPTVRCAACAKRWAAVQQILGVLPELRRRYGDHAAQHRLGCTLVALDLCRDRRIWNSVESAKDAVKLINALAECGAALRFAALLVPTIHILGSMCARSPWAHLVREDLDGPQRRLRTAYARLLHERVAASSAPVRVLCPELPEKLTSDPNMVAIPGACCLCGLPTAVVPRGEAPYIIGLDEPEHRFKPVDADADAWLTRVQNRRHERETGTLEMGSTSPLTGLRPAPVPTWRFRQVSPHQLGVPMPNLKVLCWTCAVCNRAIDPPPGSGRMPSFGPMTTDAVLIKFLNADRSGGFDPFRGDALEGAHPWGATVLRARRRGLPPPPPNRVGWQHLGDPDDLRRDLGGRVTVAG